MRSPARGRGRIRALRTPAGIALLYVLFVVLWQAGSHHLLQLFFHEPEQLTRVDRLEDIILATLTGMVLYLLLGNWRRSLTAADHRQRLERALKASNSGWWDWERQTGEIYYSPRWWQMLGYEVDAYPPNTELWRRLAHPGDAERIDRMLDEAFKGGHDSAETEVRLLHKDGHYVPILARCFIQRDAAGRVKCVSGTNVDITERKKNEERLRQAAIVFETTRESVIVTDGERRIVMVNPAFTEISGYTEHEIIGQPASILNPTQRPEEAYAGIWETARASGYWQGEIWSRRKNGEIYPELLSMTAVRDDAGGIKNYVAVLTDISRLKASETKLAFLAHHDPLTRLPNRLLVMSRLEHAIDMAARENARLALLMLDLDRFKDVNDSFGHGTGDELLQQVATRLATYVRDVDTVSRLGGDEFAIVLETIEQPEDAARIANEIILGLSAPWPLSNGVEVRIGVSIGISIFPDHGVTTNELMQQADAALYQAKTEGRGCFRYFSENLTRGARERIELEARLHRAIGNGELRVHYQPQIDIASGRIVGAEALVRWQDPQHGLIPPNRFIPIAEATGLINEIAEWVLRETCLQGRRWIDAGLPRLTLGVNLSPRQFLHGDIGDTVAKMLAETGFPATCLELELTESALMEREAEAVEILNRLRALGVRLAIDDFGTGYSSLAYLKRFPLDVLKIDKRFVDDIPHDGDDMEIAAAIVAMGHSLGLKVLAEGVERADQLAFLRQKGCDTYQGYLTSAPVPAAAFAALLARRFGPVPTVLPTWRQRLSQKRDRTILDRHPLSEDGPE
ncbi:MAG TPA: EAL domain-containing protein [Burkholderiaceae bacterium]|nr:EAL domain-containing protein [Burkholderiaceae bacterium]